MTDFNALVKQLAKASLEIKAIKFNADNPFTWASGYRMPIYNDNRMHLAFFKNRRLIAHALSSKASQLKQNEFDFVAGTSTAGIAPASSLAIEYEGTPLLIIESKKLYCFEPDIVIDITNKTIAKSNDADVIASTCPFAIPFGVNLANDLQFPFIYVRQKKKEHGLKQQIEGIIKEGQKVFLVDYNIGDNYFNAAVDAIEEKGGKIIGSISENIESIIEGGDIKEKKVLVVEDLISTGGSSVSEVKAYRENGAIVVGCVSIFNYGLDEAMYKFKEADCEARSVLTYNYLLKVAKEKGYLTEKQFKLLEEWRSDPSNWGEKHGFPKVEKGNKK